MYIQNILKKHPKSTKKSSKIHQKYTKKHPKYTKKYTKNTPKISLIFYVPGTPVPSANAKNNSTNISRTNWPQVRPLYAAFCKFCKFAQSLFKLLVALACLVRHLTDWLAHCGAWCIDGSQLSAANTHLFASRDFSLESAADDFFAHVRHKIHHY